MAKEKADYGISVFINCPFDAAYLKTLHAITFAIRLAGFIPRSALEEDDSGTVRLHRIYKIVEECKFGIHDMSRLEAGVAGELPRMNMPFECGVFFGAMRFGARHHRQKRLLILETEPHLTQKTLSDIAGNDPKAHGNSPDSAIEKVLSFLPAQGATGASPGLEYALELYAEFGKALPALAEELKHSQIGISKLEHWKTFVVVVGKFLQRRLPADPGPSG